MKKTILSLLIAIVFFSACKKEQHLLIIQEACLPQFSNPDLRAYSCDSIIPVSYTAKHCGFLPLSQKNYWVYEDSIFDNGIFVKKQYDTLRFSKTYRTPDGLIWWENENFIGLPEKIYANDSSLFMMEERLFSPECMMDVKKDYCLFEGDSIRYLTRFYDFAAAGRSVKLEDTFITPAGKFENCILFDKNARSFRRDQTIFKPGLGVIKFIQEKAPMGSLQVKLQQISTLISFHIE